MQLWKSNRDCLDGRDTEMAIISCVCFERIDIWGAVGEKAKRVTVKVVLWHQGDCKGQM